MTIERNLRNQAKLGELAMLDAIGDIVLAHKPKAKSKPARSRKRRATKIAKAK